MSIEVSYDYDDHDSLGETLNLLCICGHKLSEHAFTEKYYYETKTHFLNVGQCVFCGCTEFIRNVGIND
jgi:hypothetical protein